MSKKNKKNSSLADRLKSKTLADLTLSRLTAPLRKPGPAGYGKHYFCVEVPHKKNKTERLYFWADRIGICDGALVARSDWPRPNAEEDTTMLAFSQFEWVRCYAASVLTGEPLVVDGRK